METSELKDEAEDGDHLAVLNFLLDVPPPLTYIPHTVPVQVRGALPRKRWRILD